MHVKNWHEFQHYKQRRPPWIKLHRQILDDFKFHRLPVASRALAPCIWLLASEYQDGNFPCDLDELSFRLHQPVSDIKSAIYPLLDAGFLVNDDGDSVTLADCKQELLPEKRREETEREDKPSASQGNGKSKSDPRHEQCRDLIFKCYSYLNDGEKPPWDGSEAKQLSLLLKAKPDLDAEKFHQWLGNYAASENINPAARPREFLPKISDYAGGALNKFGRPQSAN